MGTANSNTLGGIILSTWALFLGFGILMLGDGLQGTLLAVRADQVFSPTITGLIMSSFYIGFLCGSVFSPGIILKVGHIRVFAALGALASMVILVHAAYVGIFTWVGLRLISGFCFAGLYVVAESWLNDRATNENRGKLLSVYMVVTYIGVAIGQLFLNLADPKEYGLYVLTSILISGAVIPLLLSATESPKFEESVNISVKQLYRISPLGFLSMFVVGLVTATVFALGPIFAQRIGLTLEQISYFMVAAVVGTVLFQWPIGALSDRFDRRLILTITTLLTATAAFVCVAMSKVSLEALFISVAVFSGLALPLYSVCIAYINDHLYPNQMIAASGTLVLVGGLGAVVGPALVAAIMDAYGNDYFFWCMGGAHLIIGLFALYRMARRPSMPADQQKSGITPTGLHPSSAAIESVQQHAKEETLSDSN